MVIVSEVSLGTVHIFLYLISNMPNWVRSWRRSRAKISAPIIEAQRALAPGSLGSATLAEHNSFFEFSSMFVRKLVHYLFWVYLVDHISPVSVRHEHRFESWFDSSRIAKFSLWILSDGRAHRIIHCRTEKKDILLWPKRMFHVCSNSHFLRNIREGKVSYKARY